MTRTGVVPLPKKEFSSFDIAAVVLELKSEILDSRVNNMYQMDTKTFTLKLHKTDKPPIRVVLEAGRRLHLTNYALENPHSPPAFCMALRKYLRGAWLVDIEQYNFERVVAFSFKTPEGLFKLILELFGEGNVILINDKGVILQALIFKKMRDRNIIRGEEFQLPPSSGKNPFEVNQIALTDSIKNAGNVEVVRMLARFLGVGGSYSEELLLRAGVDKGKACNILTDEEIKAIFESLQSLLSPFSTRKFEPVIVLNEQGDFFDVTPFKLNRYEGFTVKTFDRFFSALDEFYVKTTSVEKAKAKVVTVDLKREEEKLKHVIDEQQRIIAESEEKTEAGKNMGNAIYAHFNELKTLLALFSKAKLEGKDWESVIVYVLASKSSGDPASIYFNSFDSRNLAINVSVDNLKFSLSIRRTLFENAAEFYEQGKKAKQRAIGALTALKQSQKQLAEFQAKLKAAEQLKSLKPAEVMEELSKRRVESKEWFEKFRWFTSSEGFLVVAGKDVVSNEVLVKKHTDSNDVVFHAEIVGSPFVVVKTGGREVGEQTLREAGEFAASFSRAWREGMGSADVYWVKPEQLSKSGPSGEFVPHGAFAVTGKRSWMRGTPLQTAVGVAEYDDELRFIGGPVDTVKDRAETFIVLVPGDLSGKDLLRQVLRTLTLNLPKEKREKLGKASIENIREFVPYTKGLIRKSP